MKVVMAALASIVLLGACAGGSRPAPTQAASVPVATATARQTVAPSPVPVDSPVASVARSVAARPCPNPEVGAGNDCLGPVAAGTYTTQRFSPTLTYTVPAGWSNLEDMAGNFLLLPPGSKLEGVNTNVSDYLGVYSSVVAPAHCTGKYDPTVKGTLEGLVGWLKADPAITLTNVHDVTVGGLSGVAMDIALKNPDGDGCPEGHWADVYVGAYPTSLVHAVDRDYPIRIFLLRNGERTLAIELADAPGGGSDYADWFAAADPVVRGLSFAHS
jgi:hypothetical protein